MGCQPLPILMPLGNRENLLSLSYFSYSGNKTSRFWSVVCESYGTKYNGEVSIHSELYIILQSNYIELCLLQSRKFIIVITPQQGFLMQFILKNIILFIVVKCFAITTHLTSNFYKFAALVCDRLVSSLLNLVNRVCIFYTRGSRDRFVDMSILEDDIHRLITKTN